MSPFLLGSLLRCRENVPLYLPACGLISLNKNNKSLQVSQEITREKRLLFQKPFSWERISQSREGRGEDGEVSTGGCAQSSSAVCF